MKIALAFCFASAASASCVHASSFSSKNHGHETSKHHPTRQHLADPHPTSHSSTSNFSKSHHHMTYHSTAQHHYTLIPGDESCDLVTVKVGTTVTVTVVASSSVVVQTSRSTASSVPTKVDSNLDLNHTFLSSGSSKPLPINSVYEADAKKIIGTIAQTYSTTKKTWTELWGYQAATIYQNLADFDYWTGTTDQESYINNLLEIVTTKSLFSRVGATDNYNDDRGWWMLAFLHAYQKYGHSQFLDKAESMFKYIVSTSQLSSKDAGTKPNKGGLKRTLKIPKSCDVDGSVYWKLTGTSTINAVSTGLIAQVGALLYSITKSEEYLIAAERAINYERRVMLNSRGIMDVDSIVASSCKRVGGDKTPYNTGLYIAANTHLYTSTGDSKYLNWATQSVTTLVNGYYGTKKSPLLLPDHYHSQDVFYRSLSEFYAMLKSKNLNTSLQGKIANFVKANADNNLAKARDGNWFTLSYLKKAKGNAWTVAGMLGSVMGAMVMT